MSNFRFIVFLSLGLNVALAEIPLPPKGLVGIAKKQPDSELSILGITIGKSTLDDVKTKFKSKEIYHEGDAGNTLYVLCFKISNGQTIAFESGELRGDTHIVNSISINNPKDAYRLDKVCEKTTLIKTKLAINGLSLGMSPELIKRLKGKPSQQTANSLLYKYEVKEKAEKGEMDIVSSFAIEFKQDFATAITASKVETY